MKSYWNLTVLLLIAITAVHCDEGDNSGDKWAVLVAGSNTYGNYRHQSDVFHAYQILTKNGFSADRIITFAFDDIANNIRNPFKGKVFNKPSYKEPGVDVYAGVKIDYKGKDVTPTNFLQVLEGNATAMKSIGTGRVLESTAADNVFLYFADHGAPGLIAFPSKYLYARDLIATFGKMSGKFNKLVFYLEACESGSMFTTLPNNTRIYALSAANPSESSWGTYCSPEDVVQGKHIGSCLGDLFSVKFLENTEIENLFNVTLNQQYDVIKRATTKSHVLQWGDMSFSDDEMSEFLVSGKTEAKEEEGMLYNLRRRLPRIFNLEDDIVRDEKTIQGTKSSDINSRMVKVRTLTDVSAREQTQQALEELTDEVLSMNKFDYIFGQFIRREIGRPEERLSGQYDPYSINFDCLEASLDHFEAEYERLSDYGLIYVKYIAEACEKWESTQTVKEELTAAIEFMDGIERFKITEQLKTQEHVVEE